MTPVDTELAAFSLASWLRWRKLIDSDHFDRFVDILKEGIEENSYEIAIPDDDNLED